ncbi:hypothetical protein P7C73_g1711, partial [Tremellales sp. Uapishka_1]
MPMRVLALCGFTQNATIYSKQLGAVRKACKEVDFVFLEPPHIVEKADMPWNQSSLDDYDSNATTEKEQQTPETTPRCWWTSNDAKTVYNKFDDTVKYLHDYLSTQPPFDGIMGFSQGACMAAILGALLVKPNLHPCFPTIPSYPSPKFLIIVGGFFPGSTTPDFTPYFPLPASLVTLHIMGRNDTLITEERGETLVVKCENARKEMHDGGHFTPSKASWRHFFNAYIMSFTEGGSKGDVPSPTADIKDKLLNEHLKKVRKHISSASRGYTKEQRAFIKQQTVSALEEGATVAADESYGFSPVNVSSYVDVEPDTEFGQIKLSLNAKYVDPRTNSDISFAYVAPPILLQSNRDQNLEDIVGRASTH